LGGARTCRQWFGQRLATPDELFGSLAFFDPEHVNIIGGPWCIGEKHHVGASYQEQANGLDDTLVL
jgi:hypothetical protein